jgi:uncharacterized protein YecT (DUF1311 family)
MLIRSVAISCLLGLASVASAQELPKFFQDCWETAQTQFAMTICASEEAKKAEAQVVEKPKRTLALAADTPEALKTLRTSQDKWVRYRDAYLEAMYPLKDKQREYGTSYVSSVGILRIKLALRRSADLDDVIAQYSPK